ncbi:MAG TPA: serine/threonine-protein kinase [Gemmatimonadales bacterium]
MDAQRWREIRSAFDELVELDPDRRPERLAALGAGDPELRHVVEALLTADADVDARLASVGAVLLPPGQGSVSAPPVHDALGLVGRTVAHFRILAPLGAGGMGAVYVAEDIRMGRQVALKLPLPGHRLDSSANSRFLQEARAAGALDHPSLCSVYEVGESEDGLLFLAMALYRGETLKARLEREGALPVPQALTISRRIAQGLAAAHEAGIVHRDLKPANVMLLPDGTVRILDFGLAKVHDLSLTVPGTLLGTAAYMSPEQIRGGNVDGRSDLWALGVVLYEMLTGRQPFGGANEVSVAHAIVHDEPVRPSVLRTGIPRPVEDLTLTLLDKDAAGRPATAGEVDGALAEVEQGRSHRGSVAPRRLRARVGLAAVGVLLLGSVGLAAYGALRPRPIRFEPNLLAVAPFEVADTSLRLWREGLVDILSLDLDGAGPLRTVPQTTVIKRWSGRADRTSAAELGRRTGAELVVFGHVVRRSGDSVGLRVAVLDRSRNVIERDVEVIGEERRMGELADSLGIRILRTLGRSRAISVHRHQSIGSRSLPALKEFLQAEQFYRLGRYDSAFTRYERSLTVDSTFVLALRRLDRVRAWLPASSASPPTQVDYLRRAVALNRGLSPRDSALLTADSFRLAAIDARTADELVANVSARVRVLEQLARRYPDDPEIWYLLGDLRMHGTPPLGGMAAPALEAFDRAIALDSGFAPAYEHVLELALELGRTERAAEYARAYPAPYAAGLDAASVRLVRMIFDSGGVRSPAVARAVRTATASTLMTAGTEHLRWWPDSAESAVVLLRELLRGDHDVSDAPPPAADSLMWRQHLASALAFRGRLRAAAEVHGRLLTDPTASRFSAMSDPFHDLALLGRIADSLVRRTYAAGLGPESDWDAGGSFLGLTPRYLGGLLWWQSRGDTASIKRFARRAGEATRSTHPRAVLHGRYFAAAAAAYLVLARGDSAGAERLFQALPDMLCLTGGCFPEKLTLARLLAARGEDRGAATILGQWSTLGGSRPAAVLAALERGRIAERLGERATALERYRFVIEAWRHADPELEVYVTEARAALTRLGP